MFLPIPGYKSFTLDNFSIDLIRTAIVGADNRPDNRNGVDISKSYDAEKGIFSFTILNQVVNNARPYLTVDICLYYIDK